MGELPDFIIAKGGEMRMLTVQLWELVVTFIAAMGIPSAVMGVIVWKLERRLTRQEKSVQERENAREELLLLVVQSTGAAVALGEATAKAVQSIPSACCNDDMNAALSYANEVQSKQKTFLSRQGIHALW